MKLAFGNIGKKFQGKIALIFLIEKDSINITHD
jgi:hypothetical protein